MSSNVEELEKRLFSLKKLADQLTSDKRWFSSPLKSDDGVHKNEELVTLAENLKVPIPHPLTIGTLLASVMGEIDSVEWALKSLTARKKHHDEA